MNLGEGEIRIIRRMEYVGGPYEEPRMTGASTRLVDKYI